jgi:ParB family chromosome partitioning protein
MVTLAAVVAAWEDSTSKQTWRNPSAWDARVLSALTEWGYEPSEVEALLTATITAPVPEPNDSDTGNEDDHTGEDRTKGQPEDAESTADQSTHDGEHVAA